CCDLWAGLLGGVISASDTGIVYRAQAALDTGRVRLDLVIPVLTSTRDPLSLLDNRSVDESRRYPGEEGAVIGCPKHCQKEIFRPAVPGSAVCRNDSQGRVFVVTDRPAFPSPPGFRVEAVAAAPDEPHAPVRVAHPDPPLIVTLIPQ